MIERDGLPSFIGIGGQRCGSTSLWNLLRADERLFLPDRKELHYFSDRDGDYREDLSNYRAYFSGSDAGQLVGEFTPNYLTSAGACRRIKAHLPDVKLLVVLRDPVSRALSHYNYRVMRGQEHRSMKRAMRADMKRCVGGDEVTSRHHAYCQMGMYGHGLAQYLKAFKAEQMLVMMTDDLKHRSDDVRQRVGAFLGLDSELVQGVDEGVRANQINSYPRWRRLEVGARNTLRRCRGREGLWVRGQCGIARRLLWANAREGTAQMNEGLGDELRAFFAKDSAKLQEMLQVELPWAE